MLRYQLYRYFLCIGMLMCLFLSAQAQTEGYRISGEIRNYHGQMAYLNLVYGDSPFPVDSAAVSGGNFVFQGAVNLRSGAYQVVLPSEASFVFLWDEQTPLLSFGADIGDIEGTMKFKGSEDNTLYYGYRKLISARKKLLDQVRNSSETLVGDADSLQLLSELQEVKKQIDIYANQVLTNAPASFTAAIIRCEMPTDVPHFEGTTEEVQLKEHRYVKAHYFDNTDWNDERLIYAPEGVLVHKVNWYMDSVLVQNADSIIAGVDLILQKSEPAPASYKFFLPYLFNKYRASRAIGMDAVYVHIAEDYVAVGRAPWLNLGEKANLLAAAAGVAPTLIGRTAPDFQVQTEDGKNIRLYDIHSPFIILIFWAPRCSHCQRSMPLLADFYDKYKSKGVQVFTVCTKINEQEKECWEYLDKMHMHAWINGSDKMGGKSGVNDLYYVRRTPKIFVLDKDKTIIAKGLEVEQLEELMNGLLQ